MPLLVYRFRVPWVDTDAAGVVHFSNYFRYCERAEEEFLRKLNLDFQLVESKYDVWLPRVSASCDFRWPLRFNQVVRVELEEVEVGEKHITYKYKVWNESEGRLSAECRIVVVSASRSKGRSVPLPRELVNLIKASALKRPSERS